MPVRLNGTLTANGKTAGDSFPGGMGTVQADGDFGSGTLSLEVSSDGGTTYTNGGTSVQLTAEGLFNFTLPSNDLLVRLDLTGATAPDIDWWISANG
jgi:hypothetical protein